MGGFKHLDGRDTDGALRLRLAAARAGLLLVGLALSGCSAPEAPPGATAVSVNGGAADAIGTVDAPATPSAARATPPRRTPNPLATAARAAPPAPTSPPTSQSAAAPPPRQASLPPTTGSAPPATPAPAPTSGPAPRLRIAAQLDPPRPRAGTDFTLKLAIANDGERAAHGVFIETSGAWERWTVVQVQPAGTFARDAGGRHIISPIEVPPHESGEVDLVIHADEPSADQLTFAVREAEPAELR